MVVQMSQIGYNYYLKFLIVGDSSVGKTSLLLSYCNEEMRPDLGATIGIDFRHKLVNLDGRNVMMQIWDTAGQERFRTLTKSYFKMAQGIILVFDITKENSFEGIKKFIKEIHDNCEERTVKVLVGNKVDLNELRTIEFDTASSFAKENNMKYFETSCKQKLNVKEVFNHLCEEVIAKNKNEGQNYYSEFFEKSLSIKSVNQEKTESKCC
jgi:small GTP-binding protein